MVEAASNACSDAGVPGSSSRSFRSSAFQQSLVVPEIQEIAVERSQVRRVAARIDFGTGPLSPPEKKGAAGTKGGIVLAVAGGMQGLRKIFISVRAEPPVLVKRYVSILSSILSGGCCQSKS